MAVRVVSSAPIQLVQMICVGCGFGLEYAPVDLQPHRTDGDGDPSEKRGYYLTCPRPECGCRQWVTEKREGQFPFRR